MLAAASALLLALLMAVCAAFALLLILTFTYPRLDRAVSSFIGPATGYPIPSSSQGCARWNITYDTHAVDKGNAAELG